MGAWGHGVFEDDTALDIFEEEFLGSADPRPAIHRAFVISGFDGEGGLEYEEAHAILVGAAVIRAAVQDIPLEDEEYEGWASWRKSIAKLDFSDLYQPAALALKEVLDPGSELQELWEEAGEDGVLWRASVQELLDWMEHAARQQG